jgi:hypothetical protein
MTFSIIFEKKERFETGRKFFKRSGSSDGFLSKGRTMADLQLEGKEPERRELLMTDER